MTPRSRRSKGKKGENEVIDIFINDGLDVQKTDSSGSGKYDKGDFVLRYKKRRYSIEVKRKESLPIKRLESEKGISDILIMRKNRQGYKVYLSLEDFILLLLSR